MNRSLELRRFGIIGITPRRARVLEATRTALRQHPAPATEQPQQVYGSAVQMRSVQYAIQALVITASSVIVRIVLQHGAQCALQGIVV
jgi:hypothetical protein